MCDTLSAVLHVGHRAARDHARHIRGLLATNRRHFKDAQVECSGFHAGIIVVIAGYVAGKLPSGPLTPLAVETNVK